MKADDAVTIRPVVRADFAALLRLNLESEHFLSPLSEARLLRLHEQAWYHRVGCIDDAVCGFLLAIAEGADYDSPNYRWFAENRQAFVYIDRIVIAATARGRGLAARLYDDLFALARERGVARITCEFDTDPPNEPSRRFHERFGFHEVGRQTVAGGKKSVSLQEAILSGRSKAPGSARV